MIEDPVRVSFGERVFRKGFGRLFRQPQIAFRQTAGNADFSRFLRFRLAAVLPQHVNSHVREGFSDGRIVVLPVHLEKSGRRGGFAGAVNIVDLVAVPIDSRYPLTAAEHGSQRIPLIFKQFHHLRGNQGSCNAVVRDVIFNSADILSPFFAVDMYRASRVKAHKNVHHNGDKMEGQVGQVDILCCDKDLGAAPRRAGKAQVAVDDALGRSGGARCIDSQGPVRAFDLWQAKPACFLGQLCQEFFVDYRAGPALVVDKVDPLFRIAERQGYDHAARFEDSQRRGNVLHFPGNENGYNGSFSNASFYQHRRDSVAEGPEGLIGGLPFSLPIRDGGFAGNVFDMLRELF